MTPAEITQGLQAIAAAYGRRAEEADGRRKAAVAAAAAAHDPRVAGHQARVAKAALVETNLWRTCKETCERGRLPVLVNSGPAPALAPAFAAVERAATAAKMIELIQPDYNV